MSGLQKEIFERDILRGDDGQVFFQLAYFDKEEAKWMRDDYIELWENIEELKIVGNQFQNPQLLEMIE